jgi:UDP-2,4-diacetamido-2,4,6-trideoxy-beta-L-altropyranose hydrolase
MRCLSLADALRRRSVAASFVCRRQPGHLAGLIEKRGFPVVLLPERDTATRQRLASSYLSWLGTTWQEDVEQTRAAIEALATKLDWLVVDHYAIGQEWESAMRSTAHRIMVIDDLANRQHDCDILLDQNLVAQEGLRYADRVPANCGRLLGPEFALLQKDYAELHDSILEREGPIKRLFIYFGGADGRNLTETALKAFLRLNRPDIHVDIMVSSANNIDSETIRRRVSGHPNIHLLGQMETLAPVMAKADLAIGAAGTTSWERLCLGLPALVVTLADNQTAIAEELHRRRLIKWLGNQDQVTEVGIAHALAELLREEPNASALQKCPDMVDGKGAERVSAIMTSDESTPLRPREANPADEALLLALSNDPETRRNSTDMVPISPETHHDWFGRCLGNQASCHIYIIELSDLALTIGQARFEKIDHAWRISYSVSPIFRRRRMGKNLLECAILKFCKDESVSELFGLVRPDNHGSRKIFESLGFRSPINEMDGMVEFRKFLNCDA